MILLCLLCLFLSAVGTEAQALSDQSLQKIRFDQNLGTIVSLDLPFRDESGKRVVLGDYFGRRPVILDLGYYGCPMLCTLVLNGMATALQDVNLQMGRDYEVVNISIDPHETAALAAEKKRSYVKRFGQAGAATGWHFLTGDEPAIRQIAAEVGFNYAYDATSRQYAHPSGLVILSPTGKVSHYLMGVVFSSADLSRGLADAGQAKVGSPVANLLLLCFHYNPFTGKYSNLILLVVRVMGLAVLATLIAFIVLARRRVRPVIVKET